MSSKEFDYITIPSSDDSIVVQALPASSKKRRLVYNYEGNMYEIALASRNKYHDAIFQALVAGAQSNRFLEMVPMTQRMYLANMALFVSWINHKDVIRDDNNKYECINDFHKFRLTEQRIRDSNAKTIKLLIASGLENVSLPKKSVLYLETLLRVTKANNPLYQKQSDSLENWFSMPWLREVIGEKNYLHLESPKRLILSFRITIAVTLLFLLEARQQWKERAGDLDSFVKTSKFKWIRSYGPTLMERVAKFTENGLPADCVTQVIWNDIVGNCHQEALRKIIAGSEKRNIPLDTKVRIEIMSFWRIPVFLSPENLNQYSICEERLIAWLAACEAIQPTDILKLKSTDFAIEFNSSGRLLLIQTQYYKGRSGSIKKPAVLIGSDVWTKALFEYLKHLPSPGRLIRSIKSKSQMRPTLAMCDDINSEFAFLFRLWKTPILKEQVNAALIKFNSSPVFFQAILGLEHGGETQTIFLRKHGGNTKSYKESAHRPLPKTVFTLSHIKTTAVHAASDVYRDSDLINHNSHTSETEKHHYLTDQNKDWVNQCGRITRLVLHDLQNVVYQPSVEEMHRSVRDLLLKTRLIESTGLQDANVINFQSSVFDIQSDSDDIIVLDNVETALYFIHYINEAEDAFQRLVALRPDFVERTLIIRIEWFNQTLMRMRSAKDAHCQYLDVRHFLPPLFEHLFETIE